MSYRVELPIFEGPLDLLLHLIKKNELDIYDIPIAEVTRQYIEYLHLMETLDISIAGEFLVMATTLMHIKSKMLLPDLSADEDEGHADPREELVKQLLEYKRYKSAAESFQKLEENQSRFFKRNFLDEMEPLPEDDGFLHDVDIFDLMSAFKDIITRLPKNLETCIELETITIASKIIEIMECLKDRDRITFDAVFQSTQTRDEAVATFLALLELIRLRRVSVRQDHAFGAMVLERGEHYERKEQELDSGICEYSGGAVES